MNNKKVIIALTLLAALALVLSGCDMFQKIKNPAVGDASTRTAITANDAPIDGGTGSWASRARSVPSKLPLDATSSAEAPDTGSVTNPKGPGTGTATFSGYVTDTSNVVTFQLKDWEITGADGLVYTATGPMTLVYTSRWYNDGGAYTDSHYSNGIHWHIEVENTSDGLVLTRATDTRTSKTALTTDYYAEAEDGTVMVYYETFGKVDGKDIATITEALNVSMDRTAE